MNADQVTDAVDAAEKIGFDNGVLAAMETITEHATIYGELNQRKLLDDLINLTKKTTTP